MLVVDTHAYVIARDDPAYATIPDVAGWVQHSVTVEQLVSLMDAAGVSKATLIQALQAHDYDNSYTIDSAARFPGRFVAVGMYDLASTETSSSAKLRYEVTRRGVRGARVTPRGFTSEMALRAWRMAEELGVPVIIAAARPDSLAAIAEIAVRFPGVRLLLEGLALTNEVYEGPPFDKQQPLFDLSRHANVYLKWCTDQLIDMPDPDWQRAFLRRLVDVYGAERVMWGSRYPYRHEPEWTYGTQLEVALRAVEELTEDEQRLVMGGSALNLWPELS